uniref:Uncharacterized protein n=1 Tax=Cacopsylla melanoneura TaxID=428564 RepID=A0A8D8TGF3_9HEMI
MFIINIGSFCASLVIFPNTLHYLGRPRKPIIHPFSSLASFLLKHLAFNFQCCKILSRHCPVFSRHKSPQPTFQRFCVLYFVSLCLVLYYVVLVLVSMSCRVTK